MSNSGTPERVSDDFKNFSRKGIANRVLVHDEKALSAHRFQDTIVKYFKENNEIYVELINMEFKR